MTNSGERSRIRIIAASSRLDDNKLVLRQSRRGYELYAHNDPSPVRCETWLQMRHVLLHLGVPYQKLDEINNRLSEGKGLIVRRGAQPEAGSHPENNVTTH